MHSWKAVRMVLTGAFIHESLYKDGSLFAFREAVRMVLTGACIHEKL
jgi:hypothetical protein